LSEFASQRRDGDKLMREANGFAKFQKQEEREIFPCYYEARSKARMGSHVRNLDYVQQNVIEGDNDMSTNVWSCFLDTLLELSVNVDRFLEVIKVHPVHPGKGHSYKIPSIEKDKLGHMKAMNKRRKWRALFREQSAWKYGIDPKVDNIESVRPKSTAQLQIVKGRVG